MLFFICLGTIAFQFIITVWVFIYFIELPNPELDYSEMNVILLLQTVVIAMVSSDVHGHVFAYMLFWHANKK